MDDSARPAEPAGRGREAAVAVLLVLCVVLVAFWEIMSNRSQRPFAPFALNAASMAEVPLQAPGWTVTRLPIAYDPVEPNVLALLVRPTKGNAPAALVRLVHGYNMVDCLRIKGSTVELVADTRETGEGAPAAALGRYPPGLQLWRVRTSSDRATLTATAMLRAGDFARTSVDTRSMPFPRVDIPDNPGWFPQGLSWRSLRHPIRNGRLFLRAKWNASRTDVLTFLNLRQPHWASEELLTLVSSSVDAAVPAEQEVAVAEAVIAAHSCVHALLETWAKDRTPP